MWKPVKWLMLKPAIQGDTLWVNDLETASKHWQTSEYFTSFCTWEYFTAWIHPCTFLLQKLDGKQQYAYKENTNSFSSSEIQKSKGTCISIILFPRTQSGGLPLTDGRPQLFSQQLNGNKWSLGSLQDAFENKQPVKLTTNNHTWCPVTQLNICLATQSSF